MRAMSLHIESPSYFKQFNFFVFGHILDLYQSLYDFFAEALIYSMTFWLSLPFHSGSLKTIGYRKQICLAYPFLLKISIVSKYCRFGIFRVIFISRMFYFRIIHEFLNSRVSIQLTKIAI